MPGVAGIEPIAILMRLTCPPAPKVHGFTLVGHAAYSNVVTRKA